MKLPRIFVRVRVNFVLEAANLRVLFPERFAIIPAENICRLCHELCYPFRGVISRLQNPGLPLKFSRGRASERSFRCSRH